jgi:cobalamin biosynthesis Mg chelatase CobN
MNPLLLTYATSRNRASWRGAGDAASPRPDPTQAAVASGVGAATAGINTITGYLRGQRTEETAETLYGIGTTALQQQASQSINAAEANRLLSVAAARLAHDQQQAAASQQTANHQAPSSKSSSVGLIVLGVAGVGAAGAAWWYLRRKER